MLEQCVVFVPEVVVVRHDQESACGPATSGRNNHSLPFMRGAQKFSFGVHHPFAHGTQGPWGNRGSPWAPKNLLLSKPPQLLKII